MQSTARRKPASSRPLNFFCKKSHVASTLEGKRIALVGSGPGVLDNERGFIDSHDVVVRVNNYKIAPQTGSRTDVFYSFFGTSIRKGSGELKRDGVKLCICKCPNAKFMESEWHRKHKKMNGVDFRYIYRKRADWWFCPTYVPTVDEFLGFFRLMGDHVPTTGFYALLDILTYRPLSIYMTGFDFFESGIHNVNERWKHRNLTDPIGHSPATEKAWLKLNLSIIPVTMDKRLQSVIAK